MSLPFRLWAIDLDDTLLGPDHQISTRNAQAIQSLLAREVTIVLASGRMYETMLPFAEQLQLKTPLICYNGALVQLPAHGEIWLQETVGADLADELRAYAAEHHLQLNYYMPGHLYSAGHTRWSDLYHERTGANIEVVPDFVNALHGTCPIKMIIVDSPERTNELLPMLRERYQGRLYVTKSNDEYLEFLPPAANKGHALEVVANRLGVPQEQTVAMGDSWNDIPMLQWAGKGIAVANAKADVRAAANLVVGSNAEDGVAQAIEQLHEIGA